MIPHRTPVFLPWIYPSLIWKIQTDQPDLYLTFDDGPVDGPTNFVLEQLATASAKATFFCIGDNIRKYPTVLRQVTASGHAVGNHTFHHLNGWRTNVQSYCDDTRLVNAGFDSLNLPRPSLFRPPYGKITFRQIKALQEYKIIMWDVLSQDYNKHLNEESCLRKTIAATRPGSIIVFHDSYKAEKNLMYVLPRFIDHFVSRKFSFKALS